MAFNCVYSYQLMRLNQDTLLKDDDHFISPDALNMFRHAMLDLDQYSDSSVDHLASSLLENIFYKNVESPLILYSQKEFEPQNLILPSTMELPEDEKSRLKFEIAEFAKAALAYANSQNRRAIQIRVIFKVRKEDENRAGCDDESKNDECSICMYGLEEDDDNIKVTPCFHVFHEECYYRWRKRSQSCPLCRSKLPVT